MQIAARHPLLVVAVLALLPFLPVVAYDYTWIDESELVQGRQILHTPSDLVSIFFEDNNNPAYHRPVNNVIHTAAHRIGAGRPIGHRLTSLGLHTVNAVLLVLVLPLLGLSRPMALGAAIVWGVHPVHAESMVELTRCPSQRVNSKPSDTLMKRLIGTWSNFLQISKRGFQVSVSYMAN